MINNLLCLVKEFLPFFKISILKENKTYETHMIDPITNKDEYNSLSIMCGSPAEAGQAI